MKRFLKISHYLSIRNPGLLIYKIQCFIALSGLISSDKNAVYFPVRIPLKSAADVTFIATVARDWCIFGGRRKANSLPASPPNGSTTWCPSLFLFYSFHINIILEQTKVNHVSTLLNNIQVTSLKHHWIVPKSACSVMRSFRERMNARISNGLC